MNARFGNRMLFLACGIVSCASTASAWELAARPGSPPSCVIASGQHGIAVAHYRWPAGEPTTLLTVGAAKGDGPLEVFVDNHGPISGRASDRRVWSRPELIAAMKTGDRLRVAWTNHRGEPTTAEINLAGLAAALVECDRALDKASQR